MPTFNNGESGSSVRSKINDAITKVDAIDQGVSTTDSPDFAGLTVDTDTLYVDSTNNRVGIGTSSPSQALGVQGDVEVSGGIYLGGTGSANYLNDYEEGTFTLSLDGSPSYGSNRTGTYVKVGNLVFCSFRIDATPDSAESGQMLIKGLPFPATDNPEGDGVAGSHFGRVIGIPFSGFLVGRVGFGQTVLSMRNVNTDGTDSSINSEDIGSFSIEASITYYTES